LGTLQIFSLSRQDLKRCQKLGVKMYFFLYNLSLLKENYFLKS
jgi:hypothetical protein